MDAMTSSTANRDGSSGQFSMALLAMDAFVRGLRGATSDKSTM